MNPFGFQLTGRRSPGILGKNARGHCRGAGRSLVPDLEAETACLAEPLRSDGRRFSAFFMRPEVVEPIPFIDPEAAKSVPPHTKGTQQSYSKQADFPDNDQYIFLLPLLLQILLKPS